MSVPARTRLLAVAGAALLAAGCNDKPTSQVTTLETPATGSADSRVVENWTHKELLAHLNANGLRLQMVGSNIGSDNGPAALFHQRDDSPNTATADGLYR